MERASRPLAYDAMRSLIDETLLREIRQRRLRFTCPHCLYYLPAPAGQVDRASGSCAHGWPNREHAREPGATETGQYLVFCKEFDLR